MHAGLISSGKDHALGLDVHELGQLKIGHNHHLFSRQIVFRIMTDETGHHGPLFSYVYGEFKEVLGAGDALGL